MKTLFSQVRIVAALSVAGALSMIGWNESAAQRQDQPFLQPSISINALMVFVVDDVAHSIWEASNKGTALSDREWRNVDEHAYQLQAAATLVSLGGTGEPDVGWALSPAWQDWSLNLRDAGVAVKRAVDAKNQMALRSAGDALVEVCEGCHKQFKPSVPTELLHVPHEKDPF